MMSSSKADPVLTPGVLVAGITVTELAEPGYSKRTRPGRWASAKMKLATLKAYGIRRTPANLLRYTFDHLIAIENGGHPSDPGNHWPQPKAEAKLKDVQENELHRGLLAGRYSIEFAAAMVRWSWVAEETL